MNIFGNIGQKYSIWQAQFLCPYCHSPLIPEVNVEILLEERGFQLLARGLHVPCLGGLHVYSGVELSAPKIDNFRILRTDKLNIRDTEKVS